MEMDERNPHYRAPTVSKKDEALSIPWNVFDILVLFRLGSIYLHRFEDFSRTTHGIDEVELHEDITLWRREQQEEWDRLSLTLALLGTMNAAVIKVTPDTGGAAASLWLGAAGLSLCWVFMVLYFSLRALPLTNLQLHNLVSDSKSKYLDRRLIALSICAPPLIALWASALFVSGILVFIWETKFDRTRYKAFAFVPVAAGVVGVLLSLGFGEYIGSRMYFERLKMSKGRWCKHGLKAAGEPRGVAGEPQGVAAEPQGEDAV